MSISSLTQKRCARRDKCINPEGQYLPPTSEYFGKNRKCKDGFNDYCKYCAREIGRRAAKQTQGYRREYYEKNKEKLLAAHKARREKIKVEYAPINRANVKKWREENPEKYKKQIREQYAKAKAKPGFKERAAEARGRYAELKRSQRVQRQLERANTPPRAVKPETIAKRAYKSAYYQKNKGNYRTAAHNRQARERTSGKHSGKDIELLLRSQKGLCWWCSAKLSADYHVDHRIPLSRGGSNNADNLCISCPSCNLSKGAKMPFEFNGRLL